MTSAGTPSRRSRAPERDPALSPADDEHVRVGRLAPRGILLGALLRPALPPRIDPVLGALDPADAARLLVTGELLERGEQGPRFRPVLVDEADESLPRPTEVVKVNQAVVTPSAVSAGSASAKSLGSTRSRVSWRRSRIPSWFSVVVRFHEKDTRSLQKLVAAKSPIAPRCPGRRGSRRSRSAIRWRCRRP